MKKMMSALLTCSLLILYSFEVFAAEGAYEPKGVFCSRESTLSLENIATMSMEQLESLELLPLNQMNRAIEESYTIPSYSVQQSETYYCGPASVLQIMKSSGLEAEIAGTTDVEKQETLASNSYLYTDRDRGTWIEYVSDTMNELTGRFREWETRLIDSNDTSTLSSMSYFTRSNLAYNYGVIFLLYPGNLSYYNNGSTSGHYISCSGLYYTDAETESFYESIELRVNDPHYLDQYFGEHIVNFMNMATCMYEYSSDRGPNNFVF